MSVTSDRIEKIAREQTGIRKVSDRSAIWQDLKIIGDDSDDFVFALADEYGDWVRCWPWDRYLSFDEGVPILAPVRSLWRFLRLPWEVTAFPSQP